MACSTSTSILYSAQTFSSTILSTSTSVYVTTPAPTTYTAYVTAASRSLVVISEKAPIYSTSKSIYSSLSTWTSSVPVSTVIQTICPTSSSASPVIAPTAASTSTSASSASQPETVSDATPITSLAIKQAATSTSATSAPSSASTSTRVYTPVVISNPATTSHATTTSSMLDLAPDVTEQHGTGDEAQLGTGGWADWKTRAVAITAVVFFILLGVAVLWCFRTSLRARWRKRRYPNAIELTPSDSGHGGGEGGYGGYDQSSEGLYAGTAAQAPRPTFMSTRNVSSLMMFDDQSGKDKGDGGNDGAMRNMGGREKTGDRYAAAAVSEKDINSSWLDLPAHRSHTVAHGLGSRLDVSLFPPGQMSSFQQVTTLPSYEPWHDDLWSGRPSGQPPVPELYAPSPDYKGFHGPMGGDVNSPAPSGTISDLDSPAILQKVIAHPMSGLTSGKQPSPLSRLAAGVAGVDDQARTQNSTTAWYDTTTRHTDFGNDDDASMYSGMETIVAGKGSMQRMPSNKSVARRGKQPGRRSSSIMPKDIMYRDSNLGYYMETGRSTYTGREATGGGRDVHAWV